MARIKGGFASRASLWSAIVSAVALVGIVGPVHIARANADTSGPQLGSISVVPTRLTRAQARRKCTSW
jgi:hypothetical protein